MSIFLEEISDLPHLFNIQTGVGNEYPSSIRFRLFAHSVPRSLCTGCAQVARSEAVRDQSARPVRRRGSLRALRACSDGRTFSFLSTLQATSSPARQAVGAARRLDQRSSPRTLQPPAGPVPRWSQDGGHALVESTPAKTAAWWRWVSFSLISSGFTPRGTQQHGI